MSPSVDVNEFRQTLKSSKNIIILSGAGLSAPSGVATFRGSAHSLWSNANVVKYSQHTTFRDDPSGSWQFYHHRRSEALAVKPNVGHITLASLYLPSVSSRVIPSASSPPLHVTQNIDELSLHAVSVLPDPEVVTVAKEHLVQMHGSIFRTRCTSCQHVKHTYEPYLTNSLKDLDKDSSQELTTSTDKLPRCGGDEWAGSNRYGRCGSLLRPDVVWFGEVPPVLGEIARKLTWCDLLLVIGTSALVQPAAGFASQVQEHGGKVAVFNLERSNNDEKADFLFLGSCDSTLPEVFGVKEIEEWKL